MTSIVCPYCRTPLEWDTQANVWFCPKGDYRERRPGGLCPAGRFAALALVCAVIFAEAWAVPGRQAFTQEWRVQVCENPVGTDPARVDVHVERRLMLGEDEVLPWAVKAQWSNAKPDHTGGY